MDIVKRLGVMAFSSRLERLSDRLKADVTTLYHQRGVDFNDDWFLVGYMLSKHESMTVSEMASALAISRPTISKISTDMASHGLITIRTDERDRRRKLLSLTELGRATVTALKPVWKALKDCTDELIAKTGQDVLKAIAEIERELKKRSMFSRVIDRLPESVHEHAHSS